MTDERLMLWLSLSKVRARKQSRKSKSIDISKFYLGSGRLDIVSLHSSTATVYDCVDACILAEIYTYLDDLSQAEKICDAAQARLGKLRKPVPDPQSLESTYLEYQYQRAILVMVEIMYSRGFTEYTKAWRRRVSMDVLRMETAPLLLHRKESNKYYDTASSENLSQAVRAGCFFSALYVLSNFKKPDSLKMAVYPLAAPTISEICHRKSKQELSHPRAIPHAAWEPLVPALLQPLLDIIEILETSLSMMATPHHRGPPRECVRKARKARKGQSHHQARISLTVRSTMTVSITTARILLFRMVNGCTTCSTL